MAIQNLKQGALIHTLGAAAQALFGFLIARIKYPQKIICGLATLFLCVSESRNGWEEWIGTDLFGVGYLECPESDCYEVRRDSVCRLLACGP